MLYLWLWGRFVLSHFLNRGARFNLCFHCFTGLLRDDALAEMACPNQRRQEQKRSQLDTYQVRSKKSRAYTFGLYERSTRRMADQQRRQRRAP